MRALIPIALAALMLACPAPAQDSRKPDMANDPAVRQSQQPEPAAQGTRSPTAHQTPTATGDLQEALAAVRKAPPALDGTPVPRPNPLASEPDQPNEPTRSADPSDLTRQDNSEGR